MGEIYEQVYKSFWSTTIVDKPVRYTPSHRLIIHAINQKLVMTTTIIGGIRVPMQGTRNILEAANSSTTANSTMHISTTSMKVRRDSHWMTVCSFCSESQRERLLCGRVCHICESATIVKVYADPLQCKIATYCSKEVRSKQSFVISAITELQISLCSYPMFVTRVLTLF